MSIFKGTAAEAEKPEGSSGSLNKSGIYDVTINAITVTETKGGSVELGFFVNYNGKDKMIYGGLRLTNNDGEPNKYNFPVYSKLCAVANISQDAEGNYDVSDPVEAVLPIGKKGADKEVMVLEDFADLEVKMRIQMEYSKYNGEIKERTNVKAFYRPDGAAASEIINDSEIGVQLEKDMAYADNVTYRDDLTAEDVAAWMKARVGGTADGKSTPSASKPKFGAGKFGKK